jgi:hypothetical protein
VAPQEIRVVLVVVEQAVVTEELAEALHSTALAVEAVLTQIPAAERDTKELL